MSLKKEIREEIKEKILRLIQKKESPYLVLNYYKISRQTVYKYLKDFMTNKIIIKNSKNEYFINYYIHDVIKLKNKNLQEDLIYRDYIRKYEKDKNDKKDNIVRILSYTFSEILNNAIEHSEGKNVIITYAENFFYIYISILDDGVGIFKKIQRDHNLKNENEAIFELKKGKMTSDSEHHSGEGIFFTSKVVDAFLIESYNKQFKAGNELFFYSFEQISDINIEGTAVAFLIDKNTDRKIKDVFDAYTTDDDGIGILNKTEITVHLAQEYLDFPMVSRSLARRILSNIDKFKVVFLDFANIETIGQGFADEIFRVFKNKHPEISIIPINANEEIEFMIKRATNTKF